MSEARYASPGALRQAVKDRLAELARERPEAQLAERFDPEAPVEVAFGEPAVPL